MNRPFDVIQAMQKRYTDMLSVLDERGRRLFAAAEARAYGLGGAYVVEQATGVARSTINRGIAAAGRPILSIDAKKKEPIGNYTNGGRELREKLARTRQ